MEKKITLTIEDFFEAAHKTCCKWADENLKDGAPVGSAVAMIHLDYISNLAVEIFGDEAKKWAKDYAAKNKEKGISDDDDGLNELEESGLLPKGMIEAIKKARGKNTKIHVEIIGVK